MGKSKPKGALENNGDFGGKEVRGDWWFLINSNKLDVGQQIHQRELEKATDKKNPAGITAILKDWLNIYHWDSVMGPPP